MDFYDFFRLDIFDNLAAVSFTSILISLSLAFFIGVFIFWIYTHTYSGVMYSTSFGVSIVALTMISTVIILAVTSNVVLSLGMVGALSIVRFRTAVKDPMDIVFLFWSITTGIVLAAGFIPLALASTVFIGCMLYMFSQRHSITSPYILMIIGSHSEMEKVVVARLKKDVKKAVIKSKTVSPGSIELNFEVRLKDEDTSFIEELNDINGVERVMLVSYNGDYMG